MDHGLRMVSTEAWVPMTFLIDERCYEFMAVRMDDMVVYS